MTVRGDETPGCGFAIVAMIGIDGANTLEDAMSRVAVI